MSALWRQRVRLAALIATAWSATLAADADYWEIRKAGRLRVLDRSDLRTRRALDRRTAALGGLRSRATEG